MGGDNVIGVKVDGKGKMDMAELRKEIKNVLEKGHEPFLVAATAGMIKKKHNYIKKS